MKVLVVSDIHGDGQALRQMLAAEPTVETVLFLGDGLRDVERAQLDDPKRRWIAVAGNCDINANEPPSRTVTLGGVPLYLTHGHNERVKTSLLTLTYTALEQSCAAALYGHTHIPRTDYRDGIVLFNPGSLATGRTYGVLELENGTVRTTVKTL